MFCKSLTTTQNKMHESMQKTNTALNNVMFKISCKEVGEGMDMSYSQEKN